MQITNIVYGNEAGSVLSVETSDQGTLSVPWPCETWHREGIQAWVDAGNTIGEWVDPVDYMAQLRADRDRLLANTDWTQLPDVDLTAEKKGEFATYRQTLRDFPANNPVSSKAEYEALVWPNQPTA